jgi:DMSO/TMAO reductase YedYZ molybdopterin-dependent catalytic subunit
MEFSTLQLTQYLRRFSLTGCQTQAKQAQLEQWHQEAIAENERLKSNDAANSSQDWKFRVQGQTEKNITLTWPAIEALATAKINTRKPFPDSPKTPSEYRGIPVSAVLKQAGVKPGVETVTIVSDDAYYITMPLKSIVANQGMLAIAENSQPIPRSNGGPLSLVFYNNPNATKRAVEQQYWSYYATHFILGTEDLKLSIGNTLIGNKNIGNKSAANKSLDRDALERLPAHTIKTVVGYKHNWTADPVDLTGIRLKDLISSQNLKISPKSVLKIQRKSMNDRDPQKNVNIPASLINRCDVMLAYRWGADRAIIPASKGGPLTLAYGKNCPSDAIKNLAWLPFVESITLESATVATAVAGVAP